MNIYFEKYQTAAALQSGLHKLDIVVYGQEI